MNHQARRHGIHNVRPRRVYFLPRNPQFQPSPRYSRQRAVDRMSNNPPILNSSDSSELSEIDWKVFNRIRRLVNWILKIINFFQSRIHEQTGMVGCSSCCICVAVTTTAAAIAVGTGLSIGLGVGLKTDGESMNSTLTGYYTNNKVEGF
jgi:hypothetical protein